MNRLWVGLGSVLALIAIGAYFWLRQTPQQLPPPAPAVSPPAIAPAEPAIKHPVQAPPGATELPPLEQADEFVSHVVRDFFDAYGDQALPDGAPKTDAPQPDSSAGHSAVADNGEKMHEEMMSSRAHEMGMEHGARQMHDEMRDRQMPQQMSGMPASGAQAGAPMKMGDPCSGSGCKAGDPAPAPMPMGHM